MRASGPSAAPHGQRRCVHMNLASRFAAEQFPATLRRQGHSSPEAATPSTRSLVAARASATVERQVQAPQHTVGVSNICARQRIAVFTMLMPQACTSAQALSRCYCLRKVCVLVASNIASICSLMPGAWTASCPAVWNQ